MNSGIKRRNFLVLVGTQTLIGSSLLTTISGCGGGGSVPTATPTPIPTPTPTPAPTPTPNIQGRLVTTISEGISEVRASLNGIIHITTMQRNVIVLREGVITYQEYISGANVYHKGQIYGADDTGNAILKLSDFPSRFFLYESNSKKLSPLFISGENIGTSTVRFAEPVCLKNNNSAIITIYPEPGNSIKSYKFLNIFTGSIDNDTVFTPGQDYEMIQINSSINNNSILVGQIATPIGQSNYTSWSAGISKNGVITKLPHLFAGGNCSAGSISSDGQIIIGAAKDRNDQWHGVYWINNEIFDIGTNMNMLIALNNKSFLYQTNAGDIFFFKENQFYPVTFTIGSDHVTAKSFLGSDSNGTIYVSNDVAIRSNLYAITIN